MTIVIPVSSPTMTIVIPVLDTGISYKDAYEKNYNS